MNMHNPITYSETSRSFLQSYYDVDGAEDCVGKVSITKDLGHVVIEANHSIYNGVSESVTIPTVDLAVEAAKYILNEFGGGE